MIDLATETVFRLAEAPRYLPRGKSGKSVHISTVFRWAQRGVRGVKLETIRIGGALHTSTRALQRFAEDLTAKSGSGELMLGLSVKRRAARAEAKLEKAGF